MDILDDIRDKITKATVSLADQKERLSEYEELEKALGRANQSLEQVSAEISELAASAKISQQTHVTVIEALKEATTALKELNPDSLKATIKATDASITEAIQDQAKEFTDELEAINKSIRAGNKATIKATDASITEAIQDQAKEFTEQLEGINQSIRTESKASIKAANETIAKTTQVQAKEFTEQLETNNQSIRAGNEAIHEKIQLQTKALLPFKWISSLTLLAVLALIVLVVRTLI